MTLKVTVDTAQSIADGLVGSVPVEAQGPWAMLQQALGELAPAAPVCSVDPGPWFGGTRARAEAIEWCECCPVRVPCASYAFAAAEPFGVWGGLTPADRGAGSP